MDVSVVVVLHDSAPQLGRLLDSLERFHRADPPQLVVVDTASRDDGAALAAGRGAEVVALDDNPGFGAANNLALARVRHDVTVLLNPDCALLDAEALPSLAAAARARDGLHAPRLLLPDGRTQDSAHPVPGGRDALLRAVFPPRAMPRRAREHFEPWRADETREVGWTIAAALAARTTTLETLGPFDPTAFLHFEDLDLALRARAAGLPTVLHPAVRIAHEGGHATHRTPATERTLAEARRRRAVVLANLGPAALRRDDAAQALTFALRGARPSFRALRAARRQNSGS